MAADDSLQWEDMREGVWWGGGGSLNAFYRSEGGQERGWEGMRLTVMVDLQ
jgi:hypothetical protein